MSRESALDDNLWSYFHLTPKKSGSQDFKRNVKQSFVTVKSCILYQGRKYSFIQFFWFLLYDFKLVISNTL